jgi:plastocyanin
MRRIAATLGTALIAFALAVPAHAGVNTTIAIDEYSYTPSNKIANAISGPYTVQFDNEGFVPHTATANSEMFDTGNIPDGGSDVALLYGAGSYPYFCTIHGAGLMKAKVSLRPTSSAASIGVGGKVTIRVGADSLEATTFDVQRRRNGGAWTRVRSMIADPTPTFTLNRVGTYDFRSRIRFEGLVSGYSPLRKVTVTEA